MPPWFALKVSRLPLARRLDFGKSLVGIRENEARMRAIGTPVDASPAAFVAAAVMAGVAGRCRRRSRSSWRSMP